MHYNNLMCPLCDIYDVCRSYLKTSMTFVVFWRLLLWDWCCDICRGEMTTLSIATHLTFVEPTAAPPHSPIPGGILTPACKEIKKCTSKKSWYNYRQQANKSTQWMKKKHKVHCYEHQKHSNIDGLLQKKSEARPMLQPLCLGIYEAGEKKKKHIKYYWNLETLWLGLIKPVSFFSSWKKIKWGCEIRLSPDKPSAW